MRCETSELLHDHNLIYSGRMLLILPASAHLVLSNAHSQCTLCQSNRTRRNAATQRTIVQNETHMRLAEFILSNVEPILTGWEIFARSIGAGRHLDQLALRDHAGQILQATARDMTLPGYWGCRAGSRKLGCDRRSCRLDGGLIPVRGSIRMAGPYGDETGRPRQVDAPRTRSHESHEVPADLGATPDRSAHCTRSIYDAVKVKRTVESGL